MPIAMTDGTTYENQLDMLFAKDMPSREETQGKMPVVDMPRRLPQPNTYTPNEEDQLSNPVAPTIKDQNDPYSWGMGSAIDEKGVAKVPNPTPKFQEIMDQADFLINPEKIQARPQDKDASIAEVDKEGNPIDRVEGTYYPSKAENLSGYISKWEADTAAFFKGGLIQVAREQGVKIPESLQTLEKILNNPELNTAMGMAAPIKWTPVKLKILSNWAREGADMKNIPEELLQKSSPKAVYLQAWERDLLEGKMTPWTNKDMEALQELKDKGMNLKDVPDQLLDRSWEAIKQKARTDLGWSSPDFWRSDNRAAENALIKWVKEGGERPFELEGIKASSINQKMKTLKSAGLLDADAASPLARKSIWDEPKNVERLKAYIEDGKSFDEIAKSLGTTRGSVAGKVDRLGIQQDNWLEQVRAYYDKNPGASNFNAYHEMRGSKKTGPVYAPEKGSGSGGGEPPGINDYRNALGIQTKEGKDLVAQIFNEENPRVKTVLRTNKPINTPITEPGSQPANDQPRSVVKQKIREELEKQGYQINSPELDAALDREWQRMVNKDKPGTFEHAEDVQKRRRDLKIIDRMPDAIRRMLTPPKD